MSKFSFEKLSLSEQIWP